MTIQIDDKTFDNFASAVEHVKKTKPRIKDAEAYVSSIEQRVASINCPKTNLAKLKARIAIIRVSPATKRVKRVEKIMNYTFPDPLGEGKKISPDENKELDKYITEGKKVYPTSKAIKNKKQFAKLKTRLQKTADNENIFRKKRRLEEKKNPLPTERQPKGFGEIMGLVKPPALINEVPFGIDKRDGFRRHLLDDIQDKKVLQVFKTNGEKITPHEGLKMKSPFTPQINDSGEALRKKPRQSDRIRIIKAKLREKIKTASSDDVIIKRKSNFDKITGKLIPHDITDGDGTQVMVTSPKKGNKVVSTGGNKQLERIKKLQEKTAIYRKPKKPTLFDRLDRVLDYSPEDVDGNTRIITEDELIKTKDYIENGTKIRPPKSKLSPKVRKQFAKLKTRLAVQGHFYGKDTDEVNHGDIITVKKGNNNINHYYKGNKKIFSDFWSDVKEGDSFKVNKDSVEGHDRVKLQKNARFDLINRRMYEAKEHKHYIQFKQAKRIGEVGEFKGATQEKYWKYWLLNAKQTNGNGWGVSNESIHANINKFIGRPFCVTAKQWFPESEYETYEHPYLPTNNLDTIFNHQAKYAAGDIVDIIREKDDYYAMIKPKAQFANQSPPAFCSPAIFQLDPHEPENKISKWEALHLAGLDRDPAYGAQIALLKGTCIGTKNECKVQFHVAKLNTTDVRQDLLDKFNITKESQERNNYANDEDDINRSIHEEDFVQNNTKISPHGSSFSLKLKKRLAGLNKQKIAYEFPADIGKELIQNFLRNDSPDVKHTLRNNNGFHEVHRFAHPNNNKKFLSLQINTIKRDLVHSHSDYFKNKFKKEKQDNFGRTRDREDYLKEEFPDYIFTEKENKEIKDHPFFAYHEQYEGIKKQSPNISTIKNKKQFAKLKQRLAVTGMPDSFGKDPKTKNDNLAEKITDIVMKQRRENIINNPRMGKPYLMRTDPTTPLIREVPFGPDTDRIENLEHNNPKNYDITRHNMNEFNIFEREQDNLPKDKQFPKLKDITGKEKDNFRVIPHGGISTPAERKHISIEKRDWYKGKLKARGKRTNRRDEDAKEIALDIMNDENPSRFVNRKTKKIRPPKPVRSDFTSIITAKQNIHKLKQRLAISYNKHYIYDPFTPTQYGADDEVTLLDQVSDDVERHASEIGLKLLDSAELHPLSHVNIADVMDFMTRDTLLRIQNNYGNDFEDIQGNEYNVFADEVKDIAEVGKYHHRQSFGMEEPRRPQNKAEELGEALYEPFRQMQDEELAQISTRGEDFIKGNRIIDKFSKELYGSALKSIKGRQMGAKQKRAAVGLPTDFDKKEKTMNAFGSGDDGRIPFGLGVDSESPDEKPSKFKLPKYSEEDYEAFRDYVQDSAFTVEDAQDAGLSEDDAFKSSEYRWKELPEKYKQKLRPYYQKHMSHELSWQKNPDIYTEGKLPAENQVYIKPNFHKNLKMENTPNFDYVKHKDKAYGEYLSIDEKDIVPKTTRAFDYPERYAKTLTNIKLKILQAKITNMQKIKDAGVHSVINLDGEFLESEGDDHFELTRKHYGLVPDAQGNRPEISDDQVHQMLKDNNFIRVQNFTKSRNPHLSIHLAKPANALQMRAIKRLFEDHQLDVDYFMGDTIDSAIYGTAFSFNDFRLKYTEAFRGKPMTQE